MRIQKTEVRRRNTEVRRQKTEAPNSSNEVDGPGGMAMSRQSCRASQILPSAFRLLPSVFGRSLLPSAFCLLSSLCLLHAQATQIPDSERTALTALYNSTAGDHWTNHDNWLGDPGTEADWHGVTVSDGHVTGLDLSSNNLTGELPPEIGDLTALERLIISDNHLGPETCDSPETTFAFPKEIKKLTSLRKLEADNNRLCGDLPPEIGKLKELWWLTLNQNKISGTFPGPLGDLVRLQILWLAGNQLSGEIVVDTGQLPALESLDLSRNGFSGKFPTSISQLTTLKVLRLRFDHLGGVIDPGSRSAEGSQGIETRRQRPCRNHPGDAPEPAPSRASRSERQSNRRFPPRELAADARAAGSPTRSKPPPGQAAALDMGARESARALALRQLLQRNDPSRNRAPVVPGIPLPRGKPVRRPPPLRARPAAAPEPPFAERQQLRRAHPGKPRPARGTDLPVDREQSAQ